MLTSSTQPALASLECRREPSGSTSRVTGYTHQTLVIIGALQPRALFVFAVKSCYVGDGPLQSDVTALHDLESERALPRLRAQFSARTGTPIQGGKFLQANNSRAHAFTDVTERNPNEILWCLPPPSVSPRRIIFPAEHETTRSHLFPHCKQLVSGAAGSLLMSPNGFGADVGFLTPAGGWDGMGWDVVGLGGVGGRQHRSGQMARWMFTSGRSATETVGGSKSLHEKA